MRAELEQNSVVSYPADHDALSHIPRPNTYLFLHTEINHFRTRLCAGTASAVQSLRCQWPIIQDDAKVYKSAHDKHLCSIKQIIVTLWKAKNCLEPHPQFGDAQFRCAAPAWDCWTSRSHGCSCSGDGLTHIQLTVRYSDCLFLHNLSKPCLLANPASSWNSSTN